VPFSISATFVPVGEAVHFASGPEFQIRILRDGTEVRTYGVNRARRSVTEDDATAYRAFVEELVPETSREDYVSALEVDARPSELPAYDRLLAGPDGQVWAQVYQASPDAPREWDVYDDEYAFLGQVQVPARFYPMAVLREALVGVWRDELGVEYVRRYLLIPAEST
jgi:hypothetical protein